MYSLQASHMSFKFISTFKQTKLKLLGQFSLYD